MKLINSYRDGPTVTVYEVAESLSANQRYQIRVFGLSQAHNPYQFEVWFQDRSISDSWVVRNTVGSILLPFIFQAFSQEGRATGVFSDPEAVAGVVRGRPLVSLRQAVIRLLQNGGELGHYRPLSDGRGQFPALAPGDDDWSAVGYERAVRGEPENLSVNEIRVRLEWGNVYSQDEITRTIIEGLG